MVGPACSPERISPIELLLSPVVLFHSPPQRHDEQALRTRPKDRSPARRETQPVAALPPPPFLPSDAPCRRTVSPSPTTSPRSSSPPPALEVTPAPSGKPPHKSSAAVQATAHPLPQEERLLAASSLTRFTRVRRSLRPLKRRKGGSRLEGGQSTTSCACL